MKAKYEKQVREMDPNLSMTDTAAYCAAMLLCAAEFGADTEDVLGRTGVPTETGYVIADRLRDQGVWDGNKTLHSGWDDPETGGVAFWMDVCTGTGLVERAKRRRVTKSRKVGRAALGKDEGSKE